MLMMTLLIVTALAEATDGQETPAPARWDMDRLMQPPATYPAGELVDQWLESHPRHGNPELCVTGEDVQALFYEGLPWKGKPTRVFAWWGIPKTEGNEKVPGIVLAHGGGGTAFDEWVRLWNRRGYAAIAMDLTGTRPGGEPGNRPRHEWGGPPHAGMQGVDAPVQEQWVYHAVADIVLAHSLLRSFPEVDAGCIGLTGISWGGFLTCITAAVDSRFRFAVPVYGCGYLTQSPAWQAVWKDLGEARTKRWFDLWDPANYVGNIAMPTLWVNGSNDRHFPLSIHGKSYERCGGQRTLCVQVGMLHSHVHGWAPEEIYAFADGLAKAGPGLVRITGQGRAGREPWVTYAGSPALDSAELVYASDASDWVECEWHTLPAQVDVANKRVRAALPGDAQVYFFNLVDDRGLIVSTKNVRVTAGEAQSPAP